MRLCTKTDFEQMLTITFGGRATEKLIFNDVCMLSQYDLIEATNIAIKMVSICGMDDDIGPISFNGDNFDIKELLDRIAQELMEKRQFLKKIYKKLYKKYK